MERVALFAIYYLLLAFAGENAAFAWPPTYGPEFTFSRLSADPTAMSDADLYKLLVDRRDLVFDHFKANCATMAPKCRVWETPSEEGPNRMGTVRVEYEDGFWFDIAVDPGSLEVRAKPSTTAEFEAVKTRLQRDIFDVMTEVGGLHPMEIGGGGGHLNTGRKSAFGDDPVMLRNYLVDRFVDHQELATLIHGFDPKNALPFSMLPKAQQGRFFELIREFDASVAQGHPWPFDQLASSIVNEVFTSNPHAADWGNPTKYQEKRMDRLFDPAIPPEEQRMEDRARAAQRSMDHFLTQITVEDGTLAYLKSLGSKLIPVSQGPHPTTEAEKLVRYFEYVKRAADHLPSSDDRTHLWERAQEELSSSLRSLAEQMKLRDWAAGKIAAPVMPKPPEPEPETLAREKELAILHLFEKDVVAHPKPVPVSTQLSLSDSRHGRVDLMAIFHTANTAVSAEVRVENLAYLFQYLQRARSLDPAVKEKLIDALIEWTQHGLPDDTSLVLAQGSLSELWPTHAPPDRARLLQALRREILSPQDAVRDAALRIATRSYPRDFGSEYRREDVSAIAEIAEHLARDDTDAALDEIAYRNPEAGYSLLSFADVTSPRFYRDLAIRQLNMPAIWSSLTPKSPEALHNLIRLASVLQDGTARLALLREIRSAGNNPALAPHLANADLVELLRTTPHDGESRQVLAELGELAQRAAQAACELTGFRQAESGSTPRPPHR